jgi:hypothetical protein
MSGIWRYNTRMSTLFPDTHPEAEKVLFDLLQKMPAWRKLEMVGQLNQTVRTLALNGLRLRYPDDSPEKLHRRLADLLLGPELAGKAMDSLIERRITVADESISVALYVVDALEKLDISYFIGGSLASALYGVARSTIDADLIADIRPEHASPLTQLLESDFYIDEEMILGAIQHQSSFNMIHLETAFKVDIFILKKRPFNQSQMKRKTLQKVTKDLDRQAFMATAEDIILAKLEWYRIGDEVSDRQWQDILGVLRAQSGRLDLEYLRHWAGELGVANLLDRALKEASL